MPPSIAALSPKEEENVKEVLGMRCRAACRPYLQGYFKINPRLQETLQSVQQAGQYRWHGHVDRNGDE